MDETKLTISEYDSGIELPFTHNVTDNEPDDVCDVFTYDEFKDWIEKLMDSD